MSVYVDVVANVPLVFYHVPHGHDSLISVSQAEI